VRSWPHAYPCTCGRVIPAGEQCRVCIATAEDLRRVLEAERDARRRAEVQLARERRTTDLALDAFEEMRRLRNEALGSRALCTSHDFQIMEMQLDAIRIAAGLKEES